MLLGMKKRSAHQTPRRKKGFFKGFGYMDQHILGQRLRPLQNAPFCPIPASGSNFNPQNTLCIPVVKIFAFLGLEQK
jgi:hypothetical protein